MNTSNRIMTRHGIAEVHAKPPRHTHKLMRETAEALCAEFYEVAAKDNRFHREWPSQQRYVRLKWGAFVDKAREILAGMLNGPYDEILKQQIYEALLKDTALRGGDVQAIH